MTFSVLHFDQKRKVIGKSISTGHLLWKLSVGFSLLALLVTLSISMQSNLRPQSSVVVPPTPTSSPLATKTSTPDDPIPVLAYYYIWFDAQSWARVKTDYPLLGRYSSDDADVMRQHIRWAKEAGIDGFLVSWKGTDKLNRRLDQLVKIAEQEHFKLAINYESLDFERAPLPADQIDADLNYFMDHYADNPVFDVFGKPMVIWSGTWKFSTEALQSVVQDKRGRILILASEKNVKGYQRLAKLVDGNAYYWSSVNPDTHSGYPEKLMAMGEAVHASGGLWIAPAAPGYDSRLLGGSTLIDRKDGETLRTEIEAALQSVPDAIGLISWNEFSENSHIEPSEDYGRQYLQVLAETRLVPPNPR